MTSQDIIAACMRLSSLAINTSNQELHSKLTVDELEAVIAELANIEQVFVLVLSERRKGTP